MSVVRKRWLMHAQIDGSARYCQRIAMLAQVNVTATIMLSPVMHLTLHLMSVMRRPYVDAMKGAMMLLTTSIDSGSSKASVA